MQPNGYWRQTPLCLRVSTYREFKFAHAEGMVSMLDRRICISHPPIDEGISEQRFGVPFVISRIEERSMRSIDIRLVLRTAFLLLCLSALQIMDAAHAVAANRPDAAQARQETSEIIDVVAEIRARHDKVQQERRANAAIAIVFFFMLTIGVVLRVMSKNNRETFDAASRWFLFGAVVAAASYLASNVYFDFATGSSSANSRGGGLVIADKATSPVLFSMMVAGKAMAGIFLLMLGSRLISRRN